MYPPKPPQKGGPPQRGGPPQKSGPGPGAPPQAGVNEGDIEQALRGNAAKAVDIGHKLGRSLKEQGLASSQIRGVLDELQRLQAHDPNALQMLRAKLAYAAGRHGPAVRSLQGILDPALRKAASNKAYLPGLKNLLEAIVSYHRFYGGK
jgi:CRISPR type III-A-associated protein Csm2